MNTTQQDLTLLHDNDLAKLGTPEAKAVLDARTEGAARVRLVLARMYGDPHRASATRWNIVPHVTDRGTIGVVDVATGTAWDSGVEAGPEVAALGLDDAHTPEGNNPALAAPVRFDGKLVQSRGEIPERAITAPAGWRRIGLPTWRGYYDRGLVPEELYTPRETWLRPKLRAFGLVTCYGDRRKPRRTLGDAAGHGARRPWITPGFELADSSWWPMTDEQRAQIRDFGREWLDSVIERMFALAGLSEDHPALQAWRKSYDPHPAINRDSRIVATLRELRKPWQSNAYSPEALLDMVLTEHLSASATWLVLGDTYIARAAYLTFEINPETAIGGRRIDIIAALLRLALWNRLLPVARHLAEHVYNPLLENDRPTDGVTSLREALTSLARQAGQHLLREIAREAREMEQRVVERYYELIGPDPVYVDQPAADAPGYRDDA